VLCALWAVSAAVLGGHPVGIGISSDRAQRLDIHRETPNRRRVHARGGARPKLAFAKHHSFGAVVHETILLLPPPPRG